MVSVIVFGVLTVIAFGVFAWSINRFVRRNAEAEATSPTRRSYLFGILGVSGVVAAVSLIALLMALFRGLFGDEGGQLRNDIQMPIALLFTVGAVAVYHFLVLREERRFEAPPAVKPKQVVLVTADENSKR